MKLICVKKADSINRPEYKYYIVVEGKKIESGWKTEKEAKDMLKELPGYLSPKVFSLSKVKSMGIDPEKDSSWKKFN